MPSRPGALPSFIFRIHWSTSSTDITSCDDAGLYWLNFFLNCILSLLLTYSLLGEHAALQLVAKTLAISVGSLKPSTHKGGLSLVLNLVCQVFQKAFESFARRYSCKSFDTPVSSNAFLFLMPRLYSAFAHLLASWIGP